MEVWWRMCDRVGGEVEGKTKLHVRWTSQKVEQRKTDSKMNSKQWIYRKDKGMVRLGVKEIVEGNVSKRKGISKIRRMWTLDLVMLGGGRIMAVVEKQLSVLLSPPRSHTLPCAPQT